MFIHTCISTANYPSLSAHTFLTLFTHTHTHAHAHAHTHTEERKFEVSEMMSYNFFSASDPDESEKEVEGSRVGVWSVNSKAIEAGRL